MEIVKTKIFRIFGFEVFSVQEIVEQTNKKVELIEIPEEYYKAEFEI